MSSHEIDILLARLDRIEKRLEHLRPILERLGRQAGRPAQEWFSIGEVAAITGLSPDHVRRHVTAGTLPVSNQGTFDKPYYRIHRKDIEEWMAKRRETPLPVRRKKKPPTGPYVSRHHKHV